MGPKKKDKKEKSAPKEEPEVVVPPPEVEPEPEIEPDIRKITITAICLEGLRPSYATSDIHLKADFMGECKLETQKHAVTERVLLEEVIIMELDLNRRNSFDKFISNPILLSLIESECETDPLAIIDLMSTDGRARWMSEASVEDLDEAIEGPKKEVKVKASKSKSSSKSGKKSKDKLGSKTSKTSKDKGSKTSKASKGSKGKGKKKSESKVVFDPMKKPDLAPPIVVGIGVLDLLPLFLGEAEFEETILLKGPDLLIMDDRMRSIGKLPKVEIYVNIDKPLPKGTIINISIESIFNIPAIMNPEMKYQLKISLPSQQKVQHINFTKCTYEKQPQKPFLHKKWFGTEVDSDYFMETDFDSVKNVIKIDLNDLVRWDLARLDFNVIKRNYVPEDDLEMFRMQLDKYRCIPIEIYVQKVDATEVNLSNISSTNSKDKGKKGKPERGSKTSKGKKSSKASADATTVVELDQPDYLHLMAYVDLCKLLYPGIKSARITCPLRTYNEDEIMKISGQADSYFRPKPPPPPKPVVAEVAPVAVVPGGKGKKASKKGSSAASSKKGGKKGGKKEPKIGNLMGKLPPPPIPPIPSQPVYSEDGLPTFCIVELELNSPLVQVRTLEDITEELHELIYESDATKKDVKSDAISQELYRETVRTLGEDLKLQYQDYLEEVAQEGPSGDCAETFITFLQHKGVYQTYLSSITRAASVYVNTIYTYDPQMSSNEYQTFISDVYVKLIQEMNSVISKVLKCGLDKLNEGLTQSDKLLMYAREASEIGAYALANRYYLRRICEDENNADVWFDYAVYHMQIAQTERALECVKESLKINPNHKNALLMYATLLDRMGMTNEAETCLLNLTLHEKTWIEGWGALYTSYSRRNYAEGMEVSLEMANKFLAKTPIEPIIDLAWTNQTLPDTVFYRTVAYFMQLRLFEEAELILAEEIFKTESGVNEYLLAVMAYYKEQYEHALMHIDNAIHLHGCNYPIVSLRGHILMAMGQEQCALDEYQKIFELFTKPDDKYLYLVYLRSALAYSKLGNTQKSRILFLHACKLQGSAFTWMCAGILYYHQNDLLSAEECLSQSNVMDTDMAETWAYLTLVNVGLRNVHEANLSYRQVLAHRLQNLELLQVVQQSIDEMNAKETTPDSV